MAGRDDRVIVRTAWGYERDRIIKRTREKFKTASHDWFTWDGKPHNPPKHPTWMPSLDPLRAYRPGTPLWDQACQQADEHEQRLASIPRTNISDRLRRDP